MAHFVYPAASPAQPTAAYPAAQAAYVAAAPQAAYATATPRAGLAYEAYPAAHATPQYAYATRTQVAVTPAVTYDQTKTYYQPAQATAYTAAETHYQAAKPVYSTGTAYNTAQRQAAQPKAQSLQVTTSGTTYVYGTAAAPAVTTYPQTNYTATTTTQAGYETALYTAATSYYQQQQAAKVTGAQWIAKKPGGPFKPKPKGPPKQPQLHYCDVCKISCAGPQTYREHLEGQKHKKKEQATKGASAPAARGGHNQLRCELCDVTCTGADAYAAHIRGAKHTKVMKLHTKLGKPIPSTDPVIVANSSSSTTTTAKVTTGTTVTSAKVIKTPVASGVKKAVTAPKITFVGGTQLKTTGTKAEEIKVQPLKPEPAAPAAAVASTTVPVATVEKALSEDGDKFNILGEKDVAPVGHEYIEEVKNEIGKVVSFNCKLCECKFNDPNAKEMHLKGRRHRLQYKKKVDPNLQVEVKPSIRARKVQEEKLRRQAQKEEFWQRRVQEERWRDEMSRMEEEMYWEHQRRYEMMEYFEWHRMGGPPGMLPPRFPGPMGPGPMMRRPDTSDDRHVMAKHTSIYPTEAELQAVQSIVSSCERGLKLVSDFLAESDAPKSSETMKKPEPVKKDIKGKVSVKAEPKKTEVKKDMEVKDENKKKEEGTSAPRVLKGVMRVGVLAKGLLLHGDLNVHLVVLCSEKPTRTMLERVADALGKQLANCEDKYEIRRCVEEAAIIVTSDKEPKTSCIITLTSPVMRESPDKEGETVSVKDPPDVLDRQKCLDALAALRHAKWFQARANGLPSCVIVIRILRDLCQRVPTWTPLNEWAMELLSEKCVSSGGGLGPGDSLRRTFECIASGILLPGGPGLYDPCEKEPTDAAASLTNQQREEITASAQHALRLIAFRQIHKVLGMDPLPPPRFQRQRFNPRKRRRTTSAGGDGDGDVAGEKKDKKDEGESGMDTGDN